jgi:hypothetical protein
MTKWQSALLLTLVLLGVYLCCHTDWFASEEIRIIHTLRPDSPSGRFREHTRKPNPAVNTVFFALNRKYNLTEVKVVMAAEVATNRYAHPLWHLVSDSKSAPTKAFVYGSFIRGMRPKVPNAEPDPIEPNVTYRLFLQAGDLKAEHDFKIIVSK